ncbi:uncharacterized protein SPAR_L01010 [Saccharomyces paradoxus]|uniref:Uncharacterized protein n=1 Tax=Saccharomyces paradoxus TaxID=27291 RepID=A0A8B8UVM7_SACPA|nr:uncharacterized protein SPAR_L01010 [Saccharomyces paradoxus]QHS74790.1 hypothetical protein SPAR_L01010 [Saccharomyces paradoxus]
MADYEGFYAYKPHKGAAIAFVVLFGILIPYALVQITMAIHRSRRCMYLCKCNELSEENSTVTYFSARNLMWTYFPFVLGIILQFVGYVLKIVFINRPEISTFIAQSVLLLIAPSLYALTIFMLFSKMARLLLMERHMIIPAKYSTVSFLVSDMIGRVLQAVGGGLLSSWNSRNTGRVLIIVGLFIQIFCYGVLMLNQLFLDYKMKRATSKILRDSDAWFQFNYILLSGIVLVNARTIVRVVQFLMGLKSYISQHEWCLYVFDTVPMFLLPLIFLVCFHARNLFKLQEKSVDIQLAKILTKESASEN